MRRSMVGAGRRTVVRRAPTVMPRTDDEPIQIGRRVAGKRRTLPSEERAGRGAGGPRHSATRSMGRWRRRMVTIGAESGRRHLGAFALPLHSAGLSLRETVAILDRLGVDRSHGAVRDWTPPRRQPEPQTYSAGICCRKRLRPCSRTVADPHACSRRWRRRCLLVRANGSSRAWHRRTPLSRQHHLDHPLTRTAPVGRRNSPRCR